VNFKIMQAVFGSSLPPNLRLSALAVASFANASGESVYPSVATVARMTGRRYHAARRDMAQLVDLGVLQLVKFRASGVREFQINFEALRPNSCDSEVTTGQGADCVTAVTEPLASCDSEGREGITPKIIGCHSDGRPHLPSTADDLELSNSGTNHRLPSGAALGAGDAPNDNGNDYTALANESLALGLLERQDAPDELIANFRRLCEQRNIHFDHGRAVTAINLALQGRVEASRRALESLRPRRGVLSCPR
jgi:hypothetical protein